MGDEKEKVVAKNEQEIASFYFGAKVLLPFLVTLLTTVVGWYLTAQNNAKEQGKLEQRVVTLEKDVAETYGKVEVLSNKVQQNEVALGRIEVQLTNVEKVSNETYQLLRAYTSANRHR